MRTSQETEFAEWLISSDRNALQVCKEGVGRIVLVDAGECTNVMALRSLGLLAMKACHMSDKMRLNMSLWWGTACARFEMEKSAPVPA